MRVERLGKEWLYEYGKGVHRTVIGDYQAHDAVNADFALMVYENVQRFCYCTVRLMSDMAFMPYGGIFPDFRGQRAAQVGFNLMVDELVKLKRLVGFQTAQDNIAMQILGLKRGFLFCGVGVQDGKLIIQMVLEGVKNV